MGQSNATGEAKREDVPGRASLPEVVDSHCHLTDERFDPDRDAVLDRARDAGVGYVVSVASSPDDAEACIALARARPEVRATAGVHPHRAGAIDGGWRDRVRELLSMPEVLAVGECGLDFYYDNAPREAQRRVFEAHVELAEETGLPLVIHSRDADEPMAAILSDLPPGVGGVVHCFTGSDALLDVALGAGLHVSFTGIVSFSGYEAGDQVRRVPAERLMVETDAPYLAPVPHRGRRNEPAFVRAVAESVATHRGESPVEVAACTTRTALRFYGLEASVGE